VCLRVFWKLSAASLRETLERFIREPTKVVIDARTGPPIAKHPYLPGFRGDALSQTEAPK
jgi:hypothetical protein